MASFRTLTPLLRTAAARRTPVLTIKRFLDTKTAPVLYSAHAKVVGARTYALSPSPTPSSHPSHTFPFQSPMPSTQAKTKLT